LETNSQQSRTRGWLALAGFVLLSFAAGIVGAMASVDAREFYAVLRRPAWAPPGWLFGPVWSALYLMMGVAAWLVWREQPTDMGAAQARRWGLRLFVFQLLLNALWTWLFFELRQGAASFIEIVVLWVAIALTLWHFSRVRPLAGWLLVPYLLWVSFASALTWVLWQANPAVL
jgi:tryptophan-rich sensory protein